MNSFMGFSRSMIKLLLSSIFLLNPAGVFACDKAQLIDYDYQVKEHLGDSYSTFGRLWALDNQKACVNSLKYAACISITPVGDIAELTVEIHKKKGTSSSYSQKINYNTSEVIRFNTLSMDIYLKIFVSHTIADLKMAGKSCENGLPNIPRQVTRKELDNMFNG